MKRQHSFSAVFLLPLFTINISFSAWTIAEDWPQFLGPNRNGISQEKGLVSSWPSTGLKISWKQSLGEGMSGIAISGNHLLTMFQDQQNQFVVCLNAKTGEKIWATAVAPRYENSMGHGPRATPTVSGDQVFAYSGEGILVCLNLKSGKIQWSKNPHQEFGVKPAEYGMASSPLVLNKQVIVQTNAGGKGNSLCSFSVENGSLKWKALDQHPGYSSPIVIPNGTGSHVLAFGGTELSAVDPLSGTVAWKFPYATEYNCNTACPIMVEKNIFISSGENHGATMLAVVKNGTSYQPREIWSSLGRQSVLRSEWQTPIVFDGHIYGLDNVGSAGPITNLVCVDAKTGEQKWIKKRFGKGNLIFADGKLIASTMKGELILINATPKEYSEIGRQRVIGQTRQAPALADGKVFLRDNREIICIDLKK